MTKLSAVKEPLDCLSMARFFDPGNSLQRFTFRRIIYRGRGLFFFLILFVH